jgi:hypothetical protein
MASLYFVTPQQSREISVNRAQGEWLEEMLKRLQIGNTKTYTYQEVKDHYEAAGLEDFELFWDNKPVSGLYQLGLLKL